MKTEIKKGVTATKEEYSSFDSLGYAFLIIGIFLTCLAIWAWSVDKTAGAIVAILPLYLITLAFTLIDADEHRCHYCKHWVYPLQQRTEVCWEEPTAYFGKNVSLTVTFHAKCHENAVDKFKIPNPAFSEFEI